MVTNIKQASVLKQTFEFTVNAVVFSVPNLGIQISCAGGTGADFTELNGTHTVQTGAAIAKFTGCDDVELGEVCEVMSKGEPDGTIKASGSGGASMVGERLLISTGSNKEFSNAQFLGAMSTRGNRRKCRRQCDG